MATMHPRAFMMTSLRHLVLGAMLWTSATTTAVAVENMIRESPMDVHPQVLGDRTVTWVDWGVAGVARARSPELIREEQDALRLWIRSPELQARLYRLAAQAGAKEQELIRRSMTQWMQEYNTVEQQTAFPRRIGIQHDEIALPLWAHGIPPDVRAGIQIIFFDDRDAAQRAFVEERRRSTTLYTQAYCTGWTSGRDRDEYWSTRPGGPVAPIAIGADSFVSFYQVTSFPAVITFGSVDTMTVDQGMD